MVCIDLSETDDRLVAYAIFWGALFPECQRIILFHNIRAEFLSETLPLSEKGIQKLMTNILGATRKRFSQQLKESDFELKIEVDFEPNSAKAILNASDKHGIGLLIMGKKRPGRGTGIIAQSVMSIDKKALPVLLVPEGKEPKLHSLVCSAELSDKERRMFDFAARLYQLRNTNNKCLHVYRLPVAYFPFIEQNDRSLEEATKKRAVERFNAFKEEVGLDAEIWNLALVQGVNISDAIGNYCKTNGTDLVLIMRSAKATPIYKVGSNTKKIMRTSLDAPLLIL